MLDFKKDTETQMISTVTSRIIYDNFYCFMVNGYDFLHNCQKIKDKSYFFSSIFSCFNKKLLMWYYVNFFMALLSQGFLVALFFEKELLDKYVEGINLYKSQF